MAGLSEDLHPKLAALKPGDHLAFFYDTPEEQRAVITSFLTIGLKNHEKILYLADLTPPPTISEHLKDHLVDVAPYLASGQLALVPAGVFFSPQGFFDPQAVVARLKMQMEQALAQGFTSLRLTAEMSWAARGLPGSERLGEFDSRLNDFCRQHPCLILCQYDRKVFGASRLLQVLDTHPVIIVGREVLENLYFLPPREFFGADPDTARFSHLLTNLRKHHQGVEALKKQARELGERLKELNCLYDVARMMGKPGSTLKDILTDMVRRIPSACRYPHLAVARLTLEGEAFTSTPYQDPNWRLKSDILVGGEKRGELLVGYLKGMSQAEAEPYLKEEQKLVDAIARLAGRVVERLWTEEALRQSELKYRTLVEKIPAITYIAALDHASSTLYVSPQIEAILGFTQEDFQADPDLWRKCLHPEDRERVLAEVAHCHATGETFTSEYRLITKNGEIKWLHDEAWLLRDNQNVPLLLQGVMIDITARRRAEEELRHYQQQLEKLVEERTAELRKAILKLHEEITERRAVEAALERSAEKIKLFAYSIIHDLKNPAIGVHGLAHLLKKQYGHLLDDRGKQFCEQIIQAAEQIANLVKRINAYIITKEVPLNIKFIKLPEILRIVKDEFAEELARRRIHWSEPMEPPPFRADGLYVLRALRNLVDNALKYGGERLTTIRIGCQASKEAVILSVQDDGVGLELEDPQQIFGIFKRYETSLGKEGAGLGLAIVKEIAERHGGTVWVDSAPGQGATFYFSLAQAEAE